MTADLRDDGYWDQRIADAEDRRDYPVIDPAECDLAAADRGGGAVAATITYAGGRPTPAKQRVRDMAAQTWALQGYDSVGMRELAEKLNIQAPSIYSHYAGKLALLEAICEPYVAALDRLAGCDPCTLAAFLEDWRALLRRHVDAIRLVHGDPAVRRTAWGRAAAMHEVRIAKRFESDHGVQRALCFPLIAAFRSPFMDPADCVDLAAIEAAGHLILMCIGPGAA